MPHAHTNPSRFRFHHFGITQTSPALLVELDIFHNAFDYSVGIVTRQEDHNVFRAKFLDTWNSTAIEKRNGFQYTNFEKIGCSLVVIVVVSLLSPPSV
jgi:hypothetical protein